MPIEDVEELPAYPANRFLQQEHDDASIAFIMRLARDLQRYNSLLVYCKQGVRAQQNHLGIIGGMCYRLLCVCCWWWAKRAHLATTTTHGEGACSNLGS